MGRAAPEPKSPRPRAEPAAAGEHLLRGWRGERGAPGTESTHPAPGKGRSPVTRAGGWGWGGCKGCQEMRGASGACGAWGSQS